MNPGPGTDCSYYVQTTATNLLVLRPTSAYSDQTATDLIVLRSNCDQLGRSIVQTTSSFVDTNDGIVLKPRHQGQVRTRYASRKLKPLLNCPVNLDEEIEGLTSTMNKGRKMQNSGGE